MPPANHASPDDPLHGDRVHGDRVHGDRVHGDLQPGEEDLWFLPLGGCGEIGMNLNLYGHAGQWLMVDCGITFIKEQDADALHGHPRHGVQMPDPAFIARRQAHLAGLIVTHAHEDHVGAVPHLWPRLRCPVFTTAFTAAILRRKLREAGLAGQVPIHVVKSGQRLRIGRFEVEWLTITHSIPEPQALVISTPAGRVFHTGDWKLDTSPLLGPAYSPDRFRQLARENILAMVCDSTNALKAGHSLSESAVVAGLRQQIESAPGRVVVTCFGSNVARLQTLARLAAETGRHVALLGRSLDNMVAAARESGYWPADLKLIDPSHLGYLPREAVLAIATGSQGEPRTALWRLAAGTHPELDLESGDRVVFSARVIPGNEHSVARLIERLRLRGVEVLEADDSERPIHASGHPCAAELRRLYQWVQPQIAVPVHGEAAHLAANSEIARQCHVPHQMVGQNGDLFVLAPTPTRQPGAVMTGRLDLFPRLR